MCNEAQIQCQLQSIMKYFITGCDSNTEWQLPWFIENFRKHTKYKIFVADFGMTKEMRAKACVLSDSVIDTKEGKGWFSKVLVLDRLKVTHGLDHSYCWLDTDCEVRSDPASIFNYVEDNKLSLVVDHPWTKYGSPWTPQGDCGPWYNTGVIAFKGHPQILDRWVTEVTRGTKHRGDQEALYFLLNQSPMNRAIYISEVPHRYNVLRLDIESDRCPPHPAVIVHWTGQKGNEMIKEQMRDK